MFNVYYFEKKLQLKSKIDKLKENYIQDQNRKKRFINLKKFIFIPPLFLKKKTKNFPMVTKKE